ncbi:hypothetical protein NHJ13734_009688 [Beauveria thailandica]
MCMTTAIDYVGAPDDCGGGDYDTFIAAASEGVTCLSGRAVTQALQDIVITDSFMMAKDMLTQESENISNADEFIGVGGGKITPSEFLRARWWDAAMVPYHRLIMGTSYYKHLTDRLGTFTSSEACGKIKRAVDSLIRYDEIPDAIPDYINKECFNEFLVALALGGSNSVLGYANALASVTDDVLACQCGCDGHPEAAELAMGSCLWYILQPRYNTRIQLVSYSAAQDEVRDAYAWPPCGARMTAAANLVLQAGVLVLLRRL